MGYFSASLLTRNWFCSKKKAVIATAMSDAEEWSLHNSSSNPSGEGLDFSKPGSLQARARGLSISKSNFLNLQNQFTATNSGLHDEFTAAF
jgi:hypothetical protein